MVDDVKPAHLCWLDLETSGLDSRPGEDVILEIAVIVTSFEYPYEEQARTHYLVKHRGEVRNMMDEYVLDMHTRSGLLMELSEPPHDPWLLTITEIEHALLELSQDWPPPVDKDPEVKKAQCLLNAGLFSSVEEATELRNVYHAARRRATDRRVVIAGNSVGFDLGFLKIHMPSFAARLSHRVFDVSAWSMGARSMGMPRLEKKEAHRAMLDIENSIEQAREIVEWSMSLDPLVKQVDRDNAYLKKGSG